MAVRHREIRCEGCWGPRTGWSSEPSTAGPRRYLAKSARLTHRLRQQRGWCSCRLRDRRPADRAEVALFCSTGRACAHGAKVPRAMLRPCSNAGRCPATSDEIPEALRSSQKYNARFTDGFNFPIWRGASEPVDPHPGRPSADLDLSHVHV